VSRRLNLSLACTKEGRFREAEEAASAVLSSDPVNIKALFRRGAARCRLGSLEEAKVDLTAALKADPRNGPAKKELKLVKERLIEQRQMDKANYGGVFAKGSMYEDKEV
ncbi:unnamed protein product, partial [Discosporangium mesarthrocarpum]